MKVMFTPYVKPITKDRMFENLAILGPLVLTTDLLLLLRGEVVLDVEQLSDLLWGLSLDHVGHSLATGIKEGLDIQEVGSEDNLKEHLLVDVHELLIPLVDVGCLLAGVIGLVVGKDWVSLVMLTPFDDFAEDRLVDVGDWNSLCNVATVLQHVLDENRTLGDSSLDGDLNVVVG